MTKQEALEQGYEVMPYLEGFIVKRNVNGENYYKSAYPYWRKEIEPNTPFVLPFYSVYKTEQEALGYVGWEYATKENMVK